MKPLALALVAACGALAACSPPPAAAPRPAATAPAPAATAPAPAAAAVDRPAPAKKTVMICRNSRTGAKAECGTPGAVMVGMKSE